MEHNIKCPKCHTVFKVDEADFANIVKQVRDQEFDKDLAERIHALEQQQASDMAAAKARSEKDLQAQLSAKNQEITNLAAQIDKLEAQSKAAIEAATLREDALKSSQKQAIALAEERAKSAAQDALNAKDQEINQLKSDMAIAHERAIVDSQKLASSRDAEISELKLKISQQDVEKQQLKESYELRLQDKDDAIERLKDLKLKLSTKAVGESLEQFCQDEFNKVRTMAFPGAYFEKDNQVSSESGSKGDFIFRDFADGTEYISIMFDMKNENDTTKTKHKNEDFFAELDKDRREKNCEYAVLVSMLESDSDYYNQGIVDVSHRYPKMFVVRPQFFIPLISLLKNAAERTITVRQELALARSQNIDITNFENDLNEWKDSWATNIKNAAKKHGDAIAQIDKAIADLQKVRDALTTSDKHLLAAENKMDKLTIKRLTAKNPTMREKFDQLSHDSADN